MYTLEQFLKNARLPWYRILTKGTYSLNRAIEYVGVSESAVDFSDFIRKNELILSSAIGSETNSEVIDQFINGVQISSASALILTNPSDEITLSASCQKRIDDAGFPVVLVPWSCRFADLLETAMNGIRKWQEKDKREFENTQQELLKAYLGKRDFKYASRIVANHFHCECIICEAGGLELGASEAQSNLLDRVRSGADVIKVSIKTGDRLYGWLYLDGKNDVDPVLFENYLSPALILCFDKIQTIQASKQIEKDDFVWELTKGSSDSSEEITRKGRILGFDLSLPYACVVGSMHLDVLTTPDHINSWIGSNIYSIKEHILALADACHRHILLTYQQNQLILFVEDDINSYDMHTSQFLTKIEDQFALLYPHLRFSWGISSTQADSTDFHEIYLQAKLAQELCPVYLAENSRYSYKSTIVFNVLALLSDNAEIQKQITSIIQPILKYDDEKQADLFHTLQVYLQLKNVSEAARSLHLHRQSLIYRINKIEELSGVSLKDADAEFLLNLAVRLNSKNKAT